MSEKVLHFYREKDVDIITKNLKKLEEKAQMTYLKNNEPTINEINKVYDVIKQYIRENNLIVYGGWAQNALIKSKNKNDAFYSEAETPDIEFYSTEPLKDLINLCDILHKKEFKYVEGTEGVHPETYKIFVNFINYADCSYMPPNIFENIPTIEVDGMKMSHPHFMFIDALRVYVDPMTSYFRLSKAFPRFTKLIHHYPFNLNNIYNKIEYETILDDNTFDNINKYIMNIVKDLKLIIIGHKAFNRLMRKSKMKEELYVQEPYTSAISYNFIEDRNRILNKLKSKFGNKISFTKYNPFFQFTDKSVEFYYNKELILKLYGRNERCIVYDYSEKSKYYYGSFQLIQLYLLVNYFHGIIRQNNFIKTVYLTLFTRLLYAKEKYLNDNNLDSLSKSPFREFTIDCLGTPVNLLRESRLKMMKNFKQNRKAKFRYKPKGEPGKIPEFKFSNSSGEPYN
tara:strand:+ start:11789 stop:13150 length:1362 start_codon:yes stop_codon:yes gene_type:complete